MWDSLGAILIAALVVKMAFDLIRPYAVWLVVGIIAYIAFERFYKNSRNW